MNSKVSVSEYVGGGFDVFVTTCEGRFLAVVGLEDGQAQDVAGFVRTLPLDDALTFWMWEREST